MSIDNTDVEVALEVKGNFLKPYPERTIIDTHAFLNYLRSIKNDYFSEKPIVGYGIGKINRVGKSRPVFSLPKFHALNLKRGKTVCSRGSWVGLGAPFYTDLMNPTFLSLLIFDSNASVRKQYINISEEIIKVLKASEKHAKILQVLFPYFTENTAIARAVIEWLEEKYVNTEIPYADIEKKHWRFLENTAFILQQAFLQNSKQDVKKQLLNVFNFFKEFDATKEKKLHNPDITRVLNIFEKTIREPWPYLMMEQIQYTPPFEPDSPLLDKYPWLRNPYKHCEAFSDAHDLKFTNISSTNPKRNKELQLFKYLMYFYVKRHKLYSILSEEILDIPKKKPRVPNPQKGSTLMHWKKGSKIKTMFMGQAQNIIFTKTDEFYKNIGMYYQWLEETGLKVKRRPLNEHIHGRLAFM